jgi:hypothetical protein
MAIDNHTGECYETIHFSRCAYISRPLVNGLLIEIIKRKFLKCEMRVIRQLDHA